MTLMDLVLRALIVVPFLDLPAAWILVRAARGPRIPLLYDRARVAVISCLAAELIAIVILLFINGIQVSWAAALFFAGLLLPGLIPVFFLLDYLRGAYDKET